VRDEVIRLFIHFREAKVLQPKMKKKVRFVQRKPMMTYSENSYLFVEERVVRIGYENELICVNISTVMDEDQLRQTVCEQVGLPKDSTFNLLLIKKVTTSALLILITHRINMKQFP
jgi:hypothetical protein